MQQEDKHAVRGERDDKLERLPRVVDPFKEFLPALSGSAECNFKAGLVR